MKSFEYKSKKVAYNEVGQGSPLLLLHGNTASSAMFDIVVKLYSHNRKVILIDFLGHGKSDRLEEFPVDFWFDEARQAIALLEEKNYGPADIIGTSGGALAALNVALERPDLVGKIIADSFEGENSLDSVVDFIVGDRRQSKSKEDSILFWEYMHGDDWEQVVDNDTLVCKRHHKEIGSFFHRDLSECKVPVLLTASMEDEFFTLADIKGKYEAICGKMPSCKLRFFPHGRHPAMLSAAEPFAKEALAFLDE